MIDLHIDRGHLRRCYVDGDLSTVAGEFGVAISSIYESMKELRRKVNILRYALHVEVIHE